MADKFLPRRRRRHYRQGKWRLTSQFLMLSLTGDWWHSPQNSLLDENHCIAEPILSLSDGPSHWGWWLAEVLCLWTLSHQQHVYMGWLSHCHQRKHDSSVGFRRHYRTSYTRRRTTQSGMWGITYRQRFCDIVGLAKLMWSELALLQRKKDADGYRAKMTMTVKYHQMMWWPAA